MLPHTEMSIMRLSCRPLLFAFALGLASSGCGTLANITAEATPSSDSRAYGPTVCEPFGGIKRSWGVGTIPLTMGPLGIIPAVVLVGVDAPLSLVGDIVTLPIVYGRLYAAPLDDSAKIAAHQEATAPTGGEQKTVPTPSLEHRLPAAGAEQLKGE
jgi:uncharacterized protein YceK